MSDQVVARFAHEILRALDETFEEERGVYLDKDTSLFKTLETISAQEASRPVSQTCASIAAQVEHVRFSIDFFADLMENIDVGPVDWGEIWRTVREVSPAEWEESKNRLKASYQRLLRVVKGFDTWEGERDISGSLGILVHTAYHLGEIRQAMCTVKAGH